MTAYNHSITREDFIKQYGHLMWYIPEEKKNQITDEVLVLFILNYGNTDSVKKLFKLFGIERVAEIFYQLASKERTNLFPQVINYFEKYFERHVH